MSTDTTKTLSEAAEVARILQSRLGSTRDFSGLDDCDRNTWDLCQRVMDAAQAQAEPVLCINPKVLDPNTGKVRSGTGALTYSDAPCAGWNMPLYAAPQPAHRVEPVTTSVDVADYIVSISAHIAHGDDQAAQADIAELLQRLAATPQPAASHPDDIAVDRFAAAMKAKLAASRAKGRSGWDDPAQCSVEYLARLLVEHVAKGDPVDVGNFAMMLHQRDAGREVLAAKAQAEPVARIDSPVQHRRDGLWVAEVTLTKPIAQYTDLYTAPPSDLAQAEPIGYMSPKQVGLIRDPADESAPYIPMRKTPKGLFTLALYAAPQPAQRAEPVVQCKCQRVGDFDGFQHHPLCDAAPVPAQAIPDDMELVDKGRIEVLTEALEHARNGLAWYQDRYPEASDGSDDEAMELVDAALLLAGVKSPATTQPPIKQAEPVQKCRTCNGHGLIGGHMADGSGYGEGCPECNPDCIPLTVSQREALLVNMMLHGKMTKHLARTILALVLDGVHPAGFDAERAHGITGGAA